MPDDITPPPTVPAEPMIPKYRFDELTQKLKTAETRITELEAQVKEGADRAERITALEKELEDTKASYEKEKSDAMRMNAVRAGLGEGVVDPDVVVKLLDMDAISLDENGKVIGLDEQMKSLRTSKPYLFTTPPNPVKPGSGTGAPAQKSYAQKLAEKKVAQKAAVTQSKNYFG